MRFIHALTGTGPLGFGLGGMLGENPLLAPAQDVAFFTPLLGAAIVIGGLVMMSYYLAEYPQEVPGT